jgi:hypothetical protein
MPGNWQLANISPAVATPAGDDFARFADTNGFGTGLALMTLRSR